MPSLSYEEMHAHRMRELGGEIFALASARLARRAVPPRFMFARSALALSIGRLGGEDREALEEFARANGIEHLDPQRPFIPFAVVRDLTAASAGAAGFLIGTEVQDSA